MYQILWIARAVFSLHQLLCLIHIDDMKRDSWFIDNIYSGDLSTLMKYGERLHFPNRDRFIILTSRNAGHNDICGPLWCVNSDRSGYSRVKPNVSGLPNSNNQQAHIVISIDAVAKIQRKTYSILIRMWFINYTKIQVLVIQVTTGKERWLRTWRKSIRDSTVRGGIVLCTVDW